VPENEVKGSAMRLRTTEDTNKQPLAVLSYWWAVNAAEVKIEKSRCIERGKYPVCPLVVSHSAWPLANILPATFGIGKSMTIPQKRIS